MNASTTQTVITVVVILALLGYRMYRQTREQRWSINGMWVVPGIFAALTVVIVAADALQQWVAIPAAVAGLALGFAIGMYQGNHTVLRFDKPNKAVFIKVTPIGTLIFIAVLAARIALRYPQMRDALQQQTPGALPVQTPTEALLGSGLLALAVGALAGLRWYIRRAFDAAP